MCFFELTFIFQNGLSDNSKILIMKFYYVLLFFICLNSLAYSQDEDNPANVADQVLTAEEISNQPNFFLDVLENANLPNDKDEVKLSVYRNESGERLKEDAWVKPEMVFQLYVMGSEETSNEFPMEAFSFPNLQTLVFPMWKFKEVPAYLPKSLPKLQYLDLQGSQISTLPETLAEMKHLDTVNLIGTNVSDTELERLKKLLPNVTFFK